MLRKIFTLIGVMGFVILIGAAGASDTGTVTDDSGDAERSEPAEESTDTGDNSGGSILGEYDYLIWMSNTFLDMSDAMNDFSVQNTLLSSDLTLATDSDWIEVTAGYIQDIYNGCDEILAYGVDDVPEKYEEVHELSRKAAVCFNLAMDDYIEGVDNMDADLLDSSSAYLLEGAAYLTDATVLMTEIE